MSSKPGCRGHAFDRSGFVRSNSCGPVFCRSGLQSSEHPNDANGIDRTPLSDNCSSDATDKQCARADRCAPRSSRLCVDHIVAVHKEHIGSLSGLSGRQQETIQIPDSVAYEAVSPGFLERLSNSATSWAGLAAPDDNAAAPPIVLINQAVARQFSPKQNPIGQRIVLSGKGMPPIFADKPREIVGVTLGDVLSGTAWKARRNRWR